ncbi:SGNH/GDSL hydrolase family protein [Gemmatimonas phototrophica]|uniref:Acylhydrolase n=1 Tax=Gemmatimonas phototrophica TaxID=1379270 RepID=A0A143BPP5_9BACT|nr:SGNH/GDSL hydrolase family protein [Gemmatimonas phototrophica]AMW06431.1 acylhydrolase [Gemmatimonas phototrophica]
MTPRSPRARRTTVVACATGLLLAVAFPPRVMSQSSSAVEFAGLARYRAANAALGAPQPGTSRVVFFGNSITEGWARHFATMFPGRPYVGRGISGQTTAQMLLRFRQDVVALKPAAVVILAGTNDIAGNTGPATLEEIQDNLAAMAELAQASGIKVLLCAILPVYDYPWKPGLQPAPKIIAINRWLKAYAAQRGATFVDYHTPFADERGGMRPEHAADGVHPTDAGYRIMAGIVEPLIQSALSKR